MLAIATSIHGHGAVHGPVSHDYDPGLGCSILVGLHQILHSR